MSSSRLDQRVYEPISAELFSLERLEHHALTLAGEHAIDPSPRPVPSLIQRVRDNGSTLLTAYRELAAAVQQENTVTPAAEWLLDNYHIAEDQVREILEDLPWAFYQELPKLASGPHAGYPRVYAIAWEYVAHTASRFDPALLLAYVGAYQRVAVLQIGELWALAITLRVVLVENLRRIAVQVLNRREARRRADELADLCLLAPDSSRPDSSRPWEELVERYGRLHYESTFCVQLVMRLRDQDPALSPALRWIDARCADLGTTADETVRLEHQRQGINNVLVRNVITSMRAISAFDWADLLEEVSLVDAALRQHAGYAEMDFASRDHYRHAVEALRRRSNWSEVDIAAKAVGLAGAAASEARPGLARQEAARHSDPGYFLIAEGRPLLERELGYRVPIGMRARRWLAPRATSVYLAAIALLTLALLALPLLATLAAGAPVWALVALTALGVFPLSDLAIALLQRSIARFVRPAFLPRLELRDGVPDRLRTLVAVPALLVDEADTRRLIEDLEIRYLANLEGAVHFALLTDWMDSAEEQSPGDDELLAIAAEGVSRLNDRHGPAANGQPRFLLLHRRRVHNEREGKWMGWERKRGKLRELNRLLRGGTDTTFVIGSASTIPTDVVYVITLDADTRLPRDRVVKLVGTIAHPLNRARFDPAVGRVTNGYAVLQPRIAPLLATGRGSSIFQSLFSGPSGIDPYAFAVSDLYQDVFGEGSYVGKGIYDVDAFEAALGNRVPENALLSHDLFEGLFARTGLVTTIDVFEEYPASMLVASSRQHRWVRGDWQLLPWILRLGRGATARGLPALSRWKMLDNLRRSIAPPATVAMLACAWTQQGAIPGIWTRVMAAAIAVPALLAVLDGLVPARRGVSLRAHFAAFAADLGQGLGRAAVQVTMLLHDAWLMLDAIVRTLIRLFVTKRRLLEWVTAAQSSAGAGTGLLAFYRRMSGSLGLLAAGTILVATAGSRQGTALAAYFGLLWIAAPAFSCLLSRQRRAAAVERMSAEQAQWLRLVARRTWGFFARFVSAEDNHLPPDNFQEAPKAAIAHRTSPTNISVYLLSTISARDFGWIGTIEAIERLEATLLTVSRLELYSGHLLNWYDTRDLRPLEPRYVSTVDSGNLAGQLLALQQSCLTIAEDALEPARARTGIGDALALVEIELRGLEEDRRLQIATRTNLAHALARARELSSNSASTSTWVEELAELRTEAETVVDIAKMIRSELEDESAAELLAAAEDVRLSIASHARDLDPVETGAIESRSLALARQCRLLFGQMRFGFLYDRAHKLFSIGAQGTSGTLDPSYYDLLASEARLTSFVAIAMGDVPVEHWFRLGRKLTPVGLGASLISWSGSMFEYLMPALVMRSPPGSLLDDTYRSVVRRQIEHGAHHGVPWGVSESAFDQADLAQIYQYRAFGVPGLGLKRGLSEDLVIAPYASALAAMVDPVAAVDNLRRIEVEGGRGRYGFYDALDYTPERLPHGESVGIVRTYMAHHQGMTILAIANVLQRSIWCRRFHAQPVVKATELLLQERSPRDVVMDRPRAEEVKAGGQVRDTLPPVIRTFESPHEAPPRTHLLSNGRYSVMLTTAGSGYSRWNGYAITRWREDATTDADGSFLLLRDVESGERWSAGFQPARVEPASYSVEFAEDRVAIQRRDRAIATTLDVVVSPEEDLELRLLTITNLGTRARVLDVTSYAEIVLAPPAADAAHRAFGSLFIETEALPQARTLLATRRPRSHDEPRIWAGHALVVEGEAAAAVQFETDRARFLGRGRSIQEAVAAGEERALSGTTGPVLDPIFSLRQRVRVGPMARVRVLFSTFAAATREKLLDIADKARDLAIFERTRMLAWTQAQAGLHHLGIERDEAHLFQRLANHVLYHDASLRAAREIQKRNRSGPSTLWGHGISGDRPIVLVRVDDPDDVNSVRQLLRAWQYWRGKRLGVDLVILNERVASYDQELQATLQGIVRANTPASREHDGLEPGEVHVVTAAHLTADQTDTLLSLARVVLSSRRGTLAEQVLRDPVLGVAPPPVPRKPAQQALRAALAQPLPKLELYNGLGGFAAGGREYVIRLDEGQSTPAPWLNVIASESFGFQVSESGAGYTWSENSRENRLTPWSNDPVGDPPGEAIFVRDEESGELFGPTLAPIRVAEASYEVAHGHGYTRFTVVAHGIALELVQFVAPDAALKVSRLVLQNRSGRPRRLSVTGYVEWVLGVTRSASSPFVVTERDSETGALLARNACNGEFALRVAFFDLVARRSSWTCDRGEFIGRNGALSRPAALTAGGRLSARAGASLDPCAALQAQVVLPAGGREEIRFVLGEGRDLAAARQLIAAGRGLDTSEALAEIGRRWDDVLGRVEVKTPDRAFDLLLNRWLLYQTLACRIWARSAFYQSSGAYGFRDQLQDVMALLITKPALARAHVLLSASRQFVEGDVQHWWHPPSGRGVRTRCSDDLLWLPYVVIQYVETTGDVAILEEQVPFLTGPLLAEGQSESYFEPQVAEQTATLYEHCARALDRSLAVGSHQLPLMGSCDWNDGMNRVGHSGAGESVWVGWFLQTTLWEFAKLAATRGEDSRVEIWRVHVTALKAALEASGWDGEWYRRAFWDDGSPLGTATADECRIDSIAQSWAVLSGAAEPTRAARAMASLDKHLVRRDERLVLLLAPPFDKSARDPGYIKGYVPGVRENGGQYTHAAAWAIMAFAALGDGDKAAELFALINPLRHAATRAGVHRYKCEPYVLAGDVYSAPPHTGRGGWTWYTGSAGWTYRAGLESILGFRVRRGRFHLDPCVPKAWRHYEIKFRHGTTHWEITVENPDGVTRGVVRLELDGKVVAHGSGIAIVEDGKTHRVMVVMGEVS